jgi:spermidine synthase
MIAAAALAAAGGAMLWWEMRPARAIAAAALAVLAAGAATRPPDLPISPYKALSQLLRYPDAQVEFSRWNANAKVDVVRSRTVRSAPGLSYTFPGVPPSLPALTIDGEGARVLPARVDAAFTDYLPTAAAYRLRQGRALVVGMGIEVLGALWHGMRSVTVLEGNPLVVDAARRFAGDTLDQPEPGAVQAVVENPRSFLKRTGDRFDVIQVPPQESFQVVASGTFSLTEHYLYTVEAFRDYLRCLTPGGVLAVTRWIQSPPSEEIRTWAAAVAATDRASSQLIALRSLSTMTILIKPAGFGRADVTAVLAFAAARKFDITYAPGVDAREGNRYNIMPSDVHREAFVTVLDPVRRAAFLRAYQFDVTPARDDRPFFFHFFKWRQVPRIIAGLGHTWQPFGGGGFLILIALLAIIAILSAGLILAPLLALRVAQAPRARGPVFAYFLALGIAYLFVEIPLVQQMILVLQHPTHAVAAVLCGLLLASGIGSLVSPRLDRRLGLVVATLAAVTLVVSLGLPWVLNASLGFSPSGQLAVLALIVLPLGVLMGMPFPAAVRMLERAEPRLIPWAWGINGCASVLGSVGAALLALHGGFHAVMLLAGLAYAGAGAAIRRAGWS